MQIELIGGRAGRTLPFLLEGVRRQKTGGGRIVVLVPEQYTLQAERELMQSLQLPGMLDLDVVSPTKLRRLIRERGGHDPRTALDGRGRSMALSQALVKCKDQLAYYKRVAASVNLPEKMAALIADFEDAGMTPDACGQAAEALPSVSSRAKMKDVCTVWRAYTELIEGRFADEMMQHEDSLRRLEQSGVLTGAHLWVYGFDLWQEPMMRLLCEAGRLTASMHVLMTSDAADAPDGRLFSAQRRCMTRLASMLRERGLICEMRFLKDDAAGRHPALAHLEKHLFARTDVPYHGGGDAIALHASATPFAEAAYAAQTLRAWHDAGIPWRRMAVALATEPSATLSMTLEAAGIPHYMTRKDSVLRHGLCRMLTASLNAATNGYQQEDVLEASRSGFSPLTEREACLLENYAIENGITRRKWLAPFTRGAQAEACEPLRLRLMEPMIALHDGLRQAKTAAESITAIWRLLEQVEAYDRLLAREEALLERGMAAEASQNRQVWQVVLGLLDQLHALLGEERAAMRDVARFVTTGLAGTSVASLPPEMDTVMIGEAGHLMPGGLDALLVMGMQDGAMASKASSLLSETERAAMSETAQRPIALTPVEQSALRASDFYRTLSLPQKYLTITFAEGAQDGAAMRPASLIGDIRRLFPDLRVSGGVTADEAAAPLAPLMALESLALQLRSIADGRQQELSPMWRQALNWLWHDQQYGARTQQMVHGLHARVTSDALSKQQAAKLFGQDSVSISRLEQFAACPFRHFVDYGLKPVPRRDYTFAPDERGTFFHAALANYATLAADTPDWPNITDEEVDRMMDRVLAPLTTEWATGPLDEHPLARQLGQHYLRMVRRAARMFTSHTRNSRFTPWAGEVAFGMDEGGLPPVILTLGDGKQIALRGVIDRIDRYEGDGGLYLRVIDYKSSPHSLEPVRMWYGLQLQLLLYLRAAEQGVHGAKPAGAFYFTVNDPVVDAKEDVKSAAEAAIARTLQLKGVVLAETEVVEAMDADVPGYSIGQVYNKDGSLSARANALNLQEMHDLLAHAEETAAKLAEGIRSGEISAAPAETSSWTACTWCEYQGVCRRDPALAGCAPRVLEKMDRTMLQEKLAQEAQERHGREA